ncbi:MAG: metallophosphoesterase [Candidatus Pacearchaeota archaeon]|nr:MAG: metallophosphoesterase [Candidatus Pacearchaeota archaeon]
MEEGDIKNLMKRGYLVEPTLTEILSNKSLSSVPLINLIMNLEPPKLISRDFFLINVPKIIGQINNLNIDKKLMFEASSYLMTFIEKEPKLEIKKEEKEKLEAEISKRRVVVTEIIEPQVKKIEVKDFVRCFRDRFLTIKNFIQEHDLKGLTSIGKISSNRRFLSVIGLVNAKRITKNKNLLLTIEDMTGKINVIVHHDKTDLFEKGKYVVLDEVIAVTGSGSNEIIFANDIIFPDIAAVEKKRSDKEEYAAFTSDIHLGSVKFLEENFLKFIDWLNGKIGSEKQRELSSKIKYLFIAGDNVDGIGVYPKQEKELIIRDIREQYKKLAEFLGKIRKDVTIIMCPGGMHDAVRLVEPQPKIPKEIAPELYELENLILTTNPSIIKIAHSRNFPGFNVLMYHGDSYDYYGDAVDPLRQNNAKLRPDMIIHFLLKKRHLAPTHTSTTYYPGEKDYLVIRNVPDIFVSGHIHKSAISSYNNILTISCSCWQLKTAFQEKFGHEPDPCKVPILNLKTGKVNMLDFS